MTGKHLIDAALAHGHEVRAFGRNVFEQLSTERSHLELFKGYLFTDSDIKKALKGVDAVLSAIGGTTDGGNRTRSLGMKKIVAGMEKRGPKRIIGIGGKSILNAEVDEEDGSVTYVYQTPGFPKKYKAVALEHLKAFQHLESSSLDWTFVCPPLILDEKATGKYNTNCNFPAEGRDEINAGDIAEFMMDELKKDDFLKCRVGIAAI